MAAAPPLPELPGIFKRLPGAIGFASDARLAILVVRHSFPVAGQPWPEGHPLNVPLLVARVKAAVLRCEVERFALGQQAEALPRPDGPPENYIHKLVNCPVEARACQALLAVLAGWDALVQWYGWGEVVRPPFNDAAQPWTVPDVPPIDGTLLDAIDTAAAELLDLLAPTPSPLLVALYVGAPATPPGAVYDGSADSAPSEAAGLPAALPDLPKMIAAPDLARLLELGVDRVESALRRFRERHPDCAEEQGNPRRNEPRWLYRTADIHPVVERLLATDGPTDG
jgi:hypothetical protein